MHGLAPRSILGAKWWNATRRAAYQSTCYHCVACGVYKLEAAYHKWLEGHEVYRIDYNRGRLYYLETVPLCHLCHQYIHDGRLQALLEQGRISHAVYAAVIQHGDHVLATAGLSRPMAYNGAMAPWGKWRLVLNGKLYPPIYKNQEEWFNAFQSNPASAAHDD